jgi:hypothetical protein
MEEFPFGTIELHDDKICLHNLALIEPSAVDVILSLMEEILELVELHSATHLRHIFLVPNVDVPAAVQFAIKRIAGPFEADFEVLRQFTRTAAFPVEHDGELATYIVVNEALPKSLTPATAHNLDTVSNVLGSFLHASIHARIKELCCKAPAPASLALAGVGAEEWSGGDIQASYTPQPKTSRIAGRGSIRELAMKTLEAYLVYRTKIAIMSENALVQLYPESDFEPAVPRHPADIAVRLEQTANELRTAIESAVMRKVTAAEGWGQSRRILFRSLFDPLARHTAYVAHTPTNPALADEPRHSRFYLSTIAPFWVRMRPELELAYTNPDETAASVETSETLLKMFLAQLGITHSGEPDGESHIAFDRRWSN